MKPDLTDVLSLIAATVFVDKQVFKSEIEAFIQSTYKLKIVKRLDPEISEAKLTQWFEANKDEIRQKVSTPYYKDWFYEVLERLMNVSDKDDILNVMRKVSHADGHVHISERALISLSERYWSPIA